MLQDDAVDDNFCRARVAYLHDLRERSSASRNIAGEQVRSEMTERAVIVRSEIGMLRRIASRGVNWPDAGDVRGGIGVVDSSDGVGSLF